MIILHVAMHQNVCYQKQVLNEEPCKYFALLWRPYVPYELMIQSLHLPQKLRLVCRLGWVSPSRRPFPSYVVRHIQGECDLTKHVENFDKILQQMHTNFPPEIAIHFLSCIASHTVRVFLATIRYPKSAEFFFVRHTMLQFTQHFPPVQISSPFQNHTLRCLSICFLTQECSAYQGFVYR